MSTGFFDLRPESLAAAARQERGLRVTCRHREGGKGCGNDATWTDPNHLLAPLRCGFHASDIKRACKGCEWVHHYPDKRVQIPAGLTRRELAELFPGEAVER